MIANSITAHVTDRDQDLRDRDVEMQDRLAEYLKRHDDHRDVQTRISKIGPNEPVPPTGRARHALRPPGVRCHHPSTLRPSTRFSGDDYARTPLRWTHPHAYRNVRRAADSRRPRFSSWENARAELATFLEVPVELRKSLCKTRGGSRRFTYLNCVCPGRKSGPGRDRTFDRGIMRRIATIDSAHPVTSH